MKMLGDLAGTHAKVWARRGYINPDHLREILFELKKRKTREGQGSFEVP